MVESICFCKSYFLRVDKSTLTMFTFSQVTGCYLINYFSQALRDTFIHLKRLMQLFNMSKFFSENNLCTESLFYLGNAYIMLKKK